MITSVARMPEASAARSERQVRGGMRRVHAGHRHRARLSRRSRVGHRRVPAALCCDLPRCQLVVEHSCRRARTGACALSCRGACVPSHADERPAPRSGTAARTAGGACLNGYRRAPALLTETTMIRGSVEGSARAAKVRSGPTAAMRCEPHQGVVRNTPLGSKSNVEAVVEHELVDRRRGRRRDLAEAEVDAGADRRRRGVRVDVLDQCCDQGGQGALVSPGCTLSLSPPHRSGTNRGRPGCSHGSPIPWHRLPAA